MSPFILKIRYQDGQRTERDCWIPGNDTALVFAEAIAANRNVISVVVLKRNEPQNLGLLSFNG